MKNIGITGSSGFIGNQLLNQLSLDNEKYCIVPFEQGFFKNEGELFQWVNKCDVIVHFAAINRSNDKSVLYETNIALINTLLVALNKSNHRPHIIFSSSTQEDNNSQYGLSKQKGRTILKEWCERNGSLFTGLIIPNVFGPFGKPFYNSVIATFCYQLCNNITPQIQSNSLIKLIYVQQLCDEIIDVINRSINDAEYKISPTALENVENILIKLTDFKKSYLDHGDIPILIDEFDVNLFNTFRSFINIKSHFPVYLKKNLDERGGFFEIIRLKIGGQVSFSTTKPEIIRGNHFHTRKVERFTVIKGKALIKLRKYNTEENYEFIIDGEDPAFVDMPIWYTHNIKNIGNEDLYTVFWINEPYDPNNPDTYFQPV